LTNTGIYEKNSPEITRCGAPWEGYGRSAAKALNCDFM
jgi:hypothetical protein